jgi:predicted ArsR family transcriptional regulator
VVVLAGSRVGDHRAAEEVAEPQSLVVVHCANDDVGARGSFEYGRAQRLEVGPVRDRKDEFDANGAPRFINVTEKTQLGECSHQLGFTNRGEITSKLAVKRQGSPLKGPYDNTGALGRFTRKLQVVSTPNENDLDPALFSATVTSLTHSFGDSTRRKVYFYLRDNPGATAAELALHCEVHANVIRHHLERLTEGGYVTFDNVPKTTVGRPAKGYRTLDESVMMKGSVRRDALLVALLEMALERLGPDASEAMAHDVGIEYGRTLVEAAGSSDSTRSVKTAMVSIAGLLTAHGFNARAEGDDAASSVVSDNCPFGSAAQHHPVLCAVDRGLIAGMLEGLGAERTNVTLTSKALGDDTCRVTA